MIVCKIIINELPDGHLAMWMEPEMDQVTNKEQAMATILDFGIKEIFDHVLRTAGSGEMIEGKNIASHARKMMEKHSPT